MFVHLSGFKQLLLCLFLIGLWHLLVFLFGTKCGNAMFDETRRRYQPFQWEQGGKWYQKHLRIKAWKDKLPQRIPEEGFSKEHMEGASIEYLDQFILETCRGEWIHGANLLLGFLILLIAPHPFKIPLGLGLIFLHLPYMIIQRYNRFRLVRCRDRARRHAASEGAVQVSA